MWAKGPVDTSSVFWRGLNKRVGGGGEADRTPENTAQSFCEGKASGLMRPSVRTKVHFEK